MTQETKKRITHELAKTILDLYYDNERMGWCKGSKDGTLMLRHFRPWISMDDAMLLRGKGRLHMGIGQDESDCTYFEYRQSEPGLDRFWEVGEATAKTPQAAICLAIAKAADISIEEDPTVQCSHCGFMSKDMSLLRFSCPECDSANMSMYP